MYTVNPERHHVIVPAAGMGRRMGDGDSAPKSLRMVAGRPILVHALSAVVSRPMLRISLIVGYRQSLIRDAVGTLFEDVPVDYVVNEDYASTEHGWSLYLAREAWQRHQAPVIFMDADNAFDTRLLGRLLAPGPANRVLVDPGLAARDRDEELVLGQQGRITGLVRGRTGDHPGCVGGFVGMNRFSSGFMGALFQYMESYFAANGRGFKYERIFDRLIHDTPSVLHYLETAGLPWVNVNHARELETARRILAGESARGRA